MRSAMVRSSSSTTSAAAEYRSQESSSEVIEELESPMGEGAFEGGRLTTDNGSSNNNNNQSDPSILYVADVRPTYSNNQDGFFYIKSARIYPQDTEEQAAAANVKKYVCYEISLRPGTETLAFTLGTIFRRYTDFLRLYDGLRQDYASLMQTVVFPKKCFMGNFSVGVVELRVQYFTQFLETIIGQGELRDSDHFLSFLQDQDLEQACLMLDERRTEEALPVLENLFVLLSRYFTDRSKPVLLMLCRLVAASAHPIPAAGANKWADLALRRFDGVCDSDLLQLYVPLLKACVYLFWKTGRDKSHLDAQLDGMRKRGINVKSGPTLSQAIHKLDPRTETA